MSDNLKAYIKKLEHYCAYQERCHQEVKSKLLQLGCKGHELDEVVYHLIENKYLNEQRFANLYTISKFNQKQWGKYRIEQQLKAKGLFENTIQEALKQIKSQDYLYTFNKLAKKIWEENHQLSLLQRKKKTYDQLVYKGYELELIHQFLEKQ